MYYKILKSGLNRLVALTLAMVLSAVYLPVEVFADNFGEGGSNNGAASGIGVPSWTGSALGGNGVGFGKFTPNFAVMLHSGDYREWILDSDELKNNLEVNNPNLAYRTDAYKDEFEKYYEGMSVTQAYSQIFRRTQVSWDEPDAKASLILMGRDLSQKKTKYNTATNAFHGAEGMNYTNQHAAYFKPSTIGGSGGYTTMWDDLADGKWVGSQSNPKGAGIYKDKIKDYLTKYFSGKSTGYATPQKFFESLVKTNGTYTKSSKEAKQALSAWAYIAGGTRAMVDGDGNSSTVRWSEVFEADKAINWEKVYITKDGLTELNWKGEMVPIGEWTEDERVLDQVAAYLDTLLSLSSAVACASQDGDNGLSASLSDQYFNAAVSTMKDASGSYAKELGNIKQSKAVIFDTWAAHNYYGNGTNDAYTIANYANMWIAYRATVHSKFGKPYYTYTSENDWYNDYNKTSLASRSNVAKYVWGNSAYTETADKIALRLSTMSMSKQGGLVTPNGITPKELLADPLVDVAYGITQSAVRGPLYSAMSGM